MDLRITLIQTSLHWEDKRANLKLFDEKIKKIAEETDLILLPEMFSTGFSMNAEKLAEEMSGDTVRWISEKAKMQNALICGSFICKEKNKYYNRLLCAFPDGTMEHYDKRHLFTYGQEPKHYSKGKDSILLEWKRWKIFPLVCYDLRFPVWSRNVDNYDLLFYVANWPERRVFAWNQLLIARAIENQCYVAGVNRIGDDGNQIYHSGDSAVLNFKGEYLFKAGNEDITRTITISKEPLSAFRKEFPVLRDADEFNLIG